MKPPVTLAQRRHVLLISSPCAHMTGVDRMGATLCNALDPAQFRITWAGAVGCERMRPLLREDVVQAILPYPLHISDELVQERQWEKRSWWLWTKIILRGLQKELRAARRLRQAVGLDKPQLVVTNSISILSGAIYARREGLPHLHIVNEWLDPTRRDCRLYARLLAFLSRRIIVTSRACARVFPAAEEGGKVRLVPEGNDVAFILSHAAGRSKRTILAQLGLSGDRPIVAQIAALRPWKGQQITVEALKLLASKSPSPLCSLLFLGGGSPEDHARLDGQINELPAAWRHAVRVERFAPNDFSLISAADIVVHPSVVPDPYPNAVREAMILGKPVIASNEGGLPDLITQNQTGRLIPARDSAALAAALGELLAAPQERERLGQAAAAWARSYLDAATRTQGFVDVMLECLDA
jgi:glycosyltransferase involved in cell wall biosynthesis